MDLEAGSSPSESAGAKAAFRKPSNDSTNRKYRRRSPLSGSSSSDGDSSRERSSSPRRTKDDSTKVFDNRDKKDDRREYDRDHGRNQYGRDGDSHRHSDRSSRSTYGHHRREDYVRREKHEEEDHRNFSKPSPLRRPGSYSDHPRRDSEHNRSREDKYSRDKLDVSGHRSRNKDREYQNYKDSSSDRGGSDRKYTNLKTEEVKSGERDRHKKEGDNRDEKRDYKKASRDRGTEGSPNYEEYRGHRTDSLSRRDSSGHSLKEASRRDSKESDDPKYTKEGKDKYYERETNKRMERHNREQGELIEDKPVLTSDNQESFAKKPKLFSSEKVMDQANDASTHMRISDETQSSSSKQAQDLVGKANTAQDCLKDSDIDAAKIAAMKAAELVNRNLIGTGYMSTDQKKKLLWGSKKSSNTEESGHRWDTSLFSDRERQEKFNKLMSLRLHWYLWPIVGCERRREGGTQTRHPRCREAERTPDGLGEAIHCWIASERWPDSWSRSLNYCHRFIWTTSSVVTSVGDILLVRCSRNLVLVNSDLHILLFIIYFCWRFGMLMERFICGLNHLKQVFFYLFKVH